jgi:hypothetical protein
VPPLPVTEVFLSLRSDSAYFGCNGYKLSKRGTHNVGEGDVIKVGSKRLRVAILKKAQSELPNEGRVSEESERSQSSKNVYYQRMEAEGSCRICLSEEGNPNDFLVAPCGCRGSCAAVHFQCLRKWVAAKVTYAQHGKLTSYFFNNFKCEICKAELPKSVVRCSAVNAEHSFLFNMGASTAETYMVLEAENEPQWSVVSLKEGETAEVGRSTASDLQLWECSVSKVHAQILRKSGEYFVKDLQSEFGTFVQLRKAMEVVGPIELEMGATVVEMRIESQ